MASRTGDGLWRQKIMLPEHKEALDLYVNMQQYRQRIELDEQELEQINRALQQSKHFNLSLSIRMYDPFETLRIVGVVENISRLHGQFRVDGEWFNVGDIEAVEVEDLEPC